jgi:hypothetical protein
MLIPLIAIWAVLATAVAVLAMYRKGLAQKEDDSLHVLHGEAVMAEQATITSKLEKVEKWGKLLTAIVVVYGVALCLYYLYLGWQESVSTVVVK